MSKKQHDYYYSFTSPPVTEPFSSSSANTDIPTPSAPPTIDQSLPPSYDAAFDPTSTQPVPPPNKRNFDGFVLDSSTPPFNPNAVQHVPMPTPEPFNHNYDQPSATSDAHVSEPLLDNVISNEDDAFRGRPAPPGYSLYRAKYEVVRDGIISRDPHINQDGEALLQFLYQHNKPPQMAIHFYGYHEETVWTTQSTRNNNGELVQERVPVTNRIDDFQFDIDCSDNISNVCQGVYILPNPKTGEQQTLRELCDEYVHSNNALKELKLTKEIDWDFNGLTRALTAAIRDSGFYENIEITYTMEDHEIIVKTDSNISRWTDNKVIRFFMFITCLWILVWPVIWVFKKKFGHSNLKSAWNMNISERDWYNLHAREIIDSCRGRYMSFNRSPFRRKPSSYSANMRL